jgi:L-asparaginase II
LGETFVEVWRGGAAESRHRVSVAVVDADGVLRGASGDSELRTYARSCIKPLQALPLVDDGVVERFGLTAAELALACGSHGGEPVHVEAARAMLARVGVDEERLACGAQAPSYGAAADALRQSGIEPGRIHNNCSGKHAGMLALAAAHGWSLDGYHEASHPVQRRMLKELSNWSDVAESDIAVAVDGCGISTFALPLDRLALAFARLGAAAGAGAAAPARVLDAMARHPEMVAGTTRLCTELMRLTAGRVIAKIGAEGVYCAVVAEERLGIALKVEDGAMRAVGPALLAVLLQLGVLTSDELERLAGHARPAVRNTRREQVGELRARAVLTGRSVLHEASHG